MADFLRRDSQQRLALSYNRHSKSNIPSALAERGSGNFDQPGTTSMGTTTMANEAAITAVLHPTPSAMDATRSGLSVLSSLSKAKTKLNLLSMLKTQDNETFKDYRKQASHFKKASLYKGNFDGNKSKGNI